MPSTKSKTRPKSSRAANNWEFSAIGTQWWIGLFEPISAGKLSSLRRAVAERIESFDKTYSRFRQDSLVSRIAKQAGTYEFPEDSTALLELYKQLYVATDGAVTPLIGDLLVSAGYDATYSFRPKALPAIPAWDEVLAQSGATITVTRPVTLDFGAAGKGYLVDLLATLLRNQGVQRFCIDAGGDMFVQGEEPFRVGLENPDDSRQVIGAAEVRNGAIAGSAPNRRAWAGYHHIMDPRALRSSSGIKAAWVMAESALLADGLATALFLVPPEQLAQFTFEYVLINDTNQCKHSPHVPATLFHEAND